MNAVLPKLCCVGGGREQRLWRASGHQVLSGNILIKQEGLGMELVSPDVERC